MKNAISFSILGGSVSVIRRASTTLLNQLVLPGVLILLAGLCLPAHAQTNEWTWMGGSSTVGSNCSQVGSMIFCGPLGVYGTLGIPAATNVPGGREGVVSWTDSSGNFWLFGGLGNDANGTFAWLNDLWKFNPTMNQWTWMGGSNTVPCESCGQPGIYGTLGTPAAGNIPGGRYFASSWIDSSGHLWLFGGHGYGNSMYLNDLWEFNPTTNEWTWMGGSSTANQPGVYGTLGIPAAGNIPGGRYRAESWTDSSGNFWLFGGNGVDANGKDNELNDLWEYNLSTNLWVWISGSSTVGSNGVQPGVYGTLGTPAAGNIPGGRDGGTSWTDSSGNVWLFGGYGYDANGKGGELNDLWEFNPTTNLWTWMGGSSTRYQPGEYGTLGTPAAGNIPVNRVCSISWTDNSGNFWLLGGESYGGKGVTAWLNDLWEFNPSTNEWAWMGGSSTSNQPGVYGILGTPTAGNVPGSRGCPTSWTDNSGNFWLFGGYGYDANDNFGQLNDLWKYQPLPTATTPTFSVAAGTYTSVQTVTISDATTGATIYYTLDGSTPTTRSTVYSGPITVSSSKTISAIATASGYTTSALATATYTITPPAAAPTFSVPAGAYIATPIVTISDATPGAIIYYTTNGTTPTASSSVYSSAITVSSSETLEAMAIAPGYSASAVASAVYTIEPTVPSVPGEWTWMGGSNVVLQPGVYGTLGVPTAGNIPVNRAASSGWTDNSGNFWLFGGANYTCNGWEALNDLWKFNPSTNEWAWMSGGICGTVQPAVYGTLGTPAAGNVPGGRYFVSSWTDGSGNFWLFGGLGFDANGNWGYLNDLWEFNPSTNQWTWMAGSNAIYQHGVYGTLGTPDAGNTPGGRGYSLSWTDSSGHLWLFGGYGTDATGNQGDLSDLWEFNLSTNQWTWMGGSSTHNQPGVYGVMGTPAAGNIPGGRESASSWTDNSGNIWVFGGFGYDANGQFDKLNDLWEFNPSTNQWAWMGGSSKTSNMSNGYYGQPGVYGILGTPATGNIPGGRSVAATWTDSSGHFWLFGGDGFDANSVFGQLNDLWEYSPSTNEWAWMGGSSTMRLMASNWGYYGQPGIYGTLGTPAAGNIPGSHQGGVSWTDSSGNFWLFGGSGFDVNGNNGYLNDLWRYQPLAASATPTFSVATGTYTSVQSVTISDATAGATIYYTLDGSTPTTGSTVYSGPITVSSSETISAIATASGYTTSAVASAAYTINLPPAAAPVFAPAAGTYTTIQTVSITDTTPGATIYYTLDGSTPTTASAIYSTALTISQTMTLKAIAAAAGYSNSAVASVTYIINLPPAATPAFTPAAGTYTSVQKVKIADSTKGASIYYTLDGSTPTTASALYSKELTVSQTMTINAIAVAAGYSNSAVASVTYILNLPAAAAPVFSLTSGTYTSIQKVKITDATTGASIYYTLDGSTPTTASTKYSGAITISQNTTINAIAVATGYSVSTVSSAIYIITLPAEAPAFTPSAGAYGQAQLVTLASTTPNATIYYTIDGTTPSETSTQYTGPIAVNATTTIKAIATAPGCTDSPVANAKFTLVSSPRVLTGLASGIATPAATLNATVHDFESAGQVWFLWGTDSTAFNSSTDKVALPALSGAQSVSAPLTGLAGGTTYYFQPVASTIGGTSYGAIQSFTTN
jgi:N-acetylneuraminic acid mutarotase